MCEYQLFSNIMGLLPQSLPQKLYLKMLYCKQQIMWHRIDYISIRKESIDWFGDTISSD